MALPIEAVLIFAGIGLFLLGAGVREGVRAYRLGRTDATPISGLSETSGRVVVQGIARRADGDVTAPFTGRDCLAYTWHVDAVTPEYRRDGVRFRRNVVERGRDAVQFVVDDGTGTVLVEPEGAEFRLAEAWVEGHEPDPADRGDLIADLGGPPGGERYDPQYYEARLDDGETVAVHGTVRAGGDELRAGRVGLRIAGRGTLVSDVDASRMGHRARRAALVSTALGVVVLAGLAYLWLVL